MLVNNKKGKTFKLKASKDILIKNDYISYLINDPIKISGNTVFLTREEAHKR